MPEAIHIYRNYMYKYVYTYLCREIRGDVATARRPVMYEASPPPWYTFKVPFLRHFFVSLS